MCMERCLDDERGLRDARLDVDNFKALYEFLREKLRN